MIACLDPQIEMLSLGVMGALILGSLAGWILKRRATTDSARLTAENICARARAWWVMFIIFIAALMLGRTAVIILFGLISFRALREFITLTPTRLGDHRSLFWIFFVITPLQYLLVSLDWYGLYSIMIPVYAFLFIPTRNVVSGDYERFFERTAKIQWGLMVCVYCVSFVPALLNLKIRGYEGQNFKLVFYLILVVQLSDVLQYVWGKCAGRHKIAPNISPNKTWEGFVGGVLTATLIGALLWKVTPFEPWQAAAISLIVTLLGFAGGLTMSAIKRDRGVKDYGNLLAGHGGIMDRIDSICFSAPVFFHLIRYFFSYE